MTGGEQRFFCRWKKPDDGVCLHGQNAGWLRRCFRICSRDSEQSQFPLVLLSQRALPSERADGARPYLQMVGGAREMGQRGAKETGIEGRRSRGSHANAYPENPRPAAGGGATKPTPPPTPQCLQPHRASRRAPSDRRARRSRTGRRVRGSSARPRRRSSR